MGNVCMHNAYCEQHENSIHVHECTVPMTYTYHICVSCSDQKIRVMAFQTINVYVGEILSWLYMVDIYMYSAHNFERN